MMNIRTMANSKEPTYSDVKAKAATARPNNTAPPMIAHPRLGTLPLAPIQRVFTNAPAPVIPSRSP